MRSILPPLKKRWKTGDVQLGLFIRNGNGSMVELTVDSASDAVAKLAAQLLLAMSSDLAVKQPCKGCGSTDHKLTDAICVMDNS